MRLITSIVFSVLLACVSACSVSAQQKAITTSSTVLAVADQAYVVAYTQASNQALEQAGSFEEYTEIMRPWDVVVNTIAEGHRRMLKLAFSVENGEPVTMTTLIASCLDIIRQVMGGLQTMRVPIPIEVTSGLAFLSSMIEALP